VCGERERERERERYRKRESEREREMVRVINNKRDSLGYLTFPDTSFSIRGLVLG
jgi:hypothetical protein